MRESISSWQKKLAEGFSSAEKLLNFLSITDVECDPSVQDQFKTRVPMSFVQRMEPGNRFDPLLLQVLAVSAEAEDHVGFSNDPLHEISSNILPGLIHKYHGRVLLTLTGA